jgi:hypothetical protein
MKKKIRKEWLKKWLISKSWLSHIDCIHFRIKKLKKMYFRGEISERDLIIKLMSLGLSEKRIAEILTLWDLEKEKKK